ncbi:MAG: hypothetical protein KA354_19930 [Phycisphaerae bacterium]|nr:hypothetical protein [Phycisphaerae bacterium]
MEALKPIPLLVSLMILLLADPTFTSAQPVAASVEISRAAVLSKRNADAA